MTGKSYQSHNQLLNTSLACYAYYVLYSYNKVRKRQRDEENPEKTHLLDLLGGKKFTQKWTRAVQLYYELTENENTTYENCGTPLNST